MKLNKSTDALKHIMEVTIISKSMNGQFVSDSDLKKVVEDQYRAFPLFFGTNKLGSGPSDLEVIQGSRRSGLTFVRQRQDGNQIGRGVLKYMENVQDLKYVKDPTTNENYYYIDKVLQQAQLRIQNDPDYFTNYKKDNVTRAEDIHTTIQYELVALGQICGYGSYVPNADRNKKVKNNQTINQDFSNILVDKFNGINSRADDIDCIWVDDNNNPIMAFEVENTTGVDSGMSRLSSLPHKIPCYIIGTKDTYNKKFVELKETSYKNSDVNFIYLSDILVSKEYIQLNDHSEAYSVEEARMRISKKFK